MEVLAGDTDASVGTSRVVFQSLRDARRTNAVTVHAASSQRSEVSSTRRNEAVSGDTMEPGDIDVVVVPPLHPSDDRDAADESEKATATAKGAATSSEEDVNHDDSPVTVPSLPRMAVLNAHVFALGTAEQCLPHRTSTCTSFALHGIGYPRWLLVHWIVLLFALAMTVLYFGANLWSLVIFLLHIAQADPARRCLVFSFDTDARAGIVQAEWAGRISVYGLLVVGVCCCLLLVHKLGGVRNMALYTLWWLLRNKGFVVAYALRTLVAIMLGMFWQVPEIMLGVFVFAWIDGVSLEQPRRWQRLYQVTVAILGLEVVAEYGRKTLAEASCNASVDESHIIHDETYVVIVTSLAVHAGLLIAFRRLQWCVYKFMLPAVPVGHFDPHVHYPFQAKITP